MIATVTVISAALAPVTVLSVTSLGLRGGY